MNELELKGLYFLILIQTVQILFVSDVGYDFGIIVLDILILLPFLFIFYYIVINIIRKRNKDKYRSINVDKETTEPLIHSGFYDDL